MRTCSVAFAARAVVVTIVAAFALLAQDTMAASTVAASAVRPATGAKLALDWFPNATHAGLYAAEYEGYFADEGLSVSVVVPPDPATRLALLATGRVDFAIESPGGLLMARSQGMPLLSVMTIIQRFLGAMMTLEESGITRVADFRGKRIGTSALPEGRARLETILEAEGIAPHEVDIIDIGWNQTPALLSGAVDVVTGIVRTWQGVEAELAGYAVRFLYWEDYGLPPIPTLVLVTSDRVLHSRPDLVERFVRAMVRGYEFAFANPQKAAEYVLRADPDLRPDLVMRSVALLAPSFRDPAPRVGWHARDQWEAYAAWMTERGLLPAGTDAHGAFTNDYLP